MHFYIFYFFSLSFSNEFIELKGKKFKVVICDESHYMKSMNAERTQVLVPIIQVLIMFTFFGN